MIARDDLAAVFDKVPEQTVFALRQVERSACVGRFEAVELGTYSVKLTAANFNTVIKNNIEVSANQIDASLAPGTQEMAVDVTAESGALLQTEAPVRGGNIQSQVITQLPLSTPVVDATGRITGYTNPDANNAPIDPATARYIINPAYTAGLANSVPRVGSLGRNTERSPRTHNGDMNILKRTRIRENKTLEFRAELFNAFNHPQYTQGSISPFSPAVGFIGNNAGTEVAGRFLNPNTALSDGGGRSGRFFVRFVF